MSDLYKQYQTVLSEIDRIFQMNKLPNLKAIYKNSVTIIENLRDILTRKSLLKKDLYQYEEEETNNFPIKEEKFFTEDQKEDIIYRRLQDLINGLEYLLSDTPESLRDFSDNYLENLRKLLDYFSFHNYTSANAGINTKTLREMTDTIFLGSDQQLATLTKDNLKNLSTSFHDLQSISEEIYKFLKEQYKVDIRFLVFTNLGTDFTETLFTQDKEKYFSKLTNYFKKNEKEVPYIKLWIKEAISACYKFSDEEYLRTIKSKFLSDQEIEQSKKLSSTSKNLQLKTLLFSLSRSSELLTHIYRQLNQNYITIKSRPKSFGEKIKGVIGTMFSIPSEDDFVNIEYIDPQTKLRESEELNIETFLKDFKNKIGILSAISKPNTKANNQIKTGSSESLNTFFDKIYFSIATLSYKISSINSKLKIKIKGNSKTKIIDLTGDLTQLEIHINQIMEEKKKLS